MLLAQTFVERAACSLDPRKYSENFRAIAHCPATMSAMSAEYDLLLQTTIDHLRELKRRHVRFVQVSPEALRILEVPSDKPRQPAAPAPSARKMAPEVAAAPAAKVVQPGPAVPHSEPVSPSARASAPPPAITPLKKASALEALAARAASCVKCPHLASSRKNVVFGVGDMDAQLMFVGEAPGADEDRLGEPFVGAAGQLLTKIIVATGLSREQVYIANILKCRPDTPGRTSGNRKPTTDEMKTCIPFLHEQIDLIQPKVIVGLGGTAMEGLLGKPVFITKLRGQWQQFRGIPLMPTYHPSYLLRSLSPMDKRNVWEDMLQVMEKLGMPISSKQRGFFGKSAG